MKLHHSRQRALLLLCLLLLPLTKAWAAGHIDSIHVLEGVVVTERLIPKDVIPAQVLGGRDLQRLSAVSVADALRYFAGVQIKDYGGIGGLKTVNVRSMGSQHVGVFYDGLQLGNAQNGQIDLGRFSLDNMETVSIYNGQRSTILQPAKSFSSAAALYMTTRRPTFAAERKTNLKAALKAGSFSTINPSPPLRAAPLPHPRPLDEWRIPLYLGALPLHLQEEGWLRHDVRSSQWRRALPAPRDGALRTTRRRRVARQRLTSIARSVATPEPSCAKSRGSSSTRTVSGIPT